MTAVGGFPASSVGVEAVLDRYGIDDPAMRRRIHREAVRRLEERATKAAVRVLMRAALEQGWRPPPASSGLPRPPDESPVPIPQALYSRVQRWIREAPGEFSARDLMRGTGVDTAADTRAVLDGLVARGDVELVEPPLRWPGQRGRRPGVRYRAAGRAGANVDAHRGQATRNASDPDDLDWSAVLKPDEI